jgi:ribonuclease III
VGSAEAREGSAGGAVEPLAALIAELSEEARAQAVTHSSWTDRRVHSWGRPAFLGDSVLGLVVAQELYRRFPRADIGRLTKVHGQAVSGRACAEVARRLGVAAMLAARHPEATEGGIAVEELVASERAMASITEALIGAVYLGFGIERTAPAVLAAFTPEIELATDTVLDFKSTLQELLARSGELVTYAVTDEAGPPHNRRFEVEARIGDEVIGRGSGPSKKAAEQVAASAALAARRD